MVAVGKRRERKEEGIGQGETVSNRLTEGKGSGQSLETIILPSPSPYPYPQPVVSKDRKREDRTWLEGW